MVCSGPSDARRSKLSHHLPAERIGFRPRFAHKSPMTIITDPRCTEHRGAALFGEWKRHLRPGIPVLEHDGDINDPAFAELCAWELLRNVAASGKG